MSGLVFHKMSGSGNDFVVFDGRFTSEAEWPEQRIKSLCDRRMGVGADGMVILTPEGGSRVRMDFWNCDGSRADMCGNAALCSTRLSALLELAPADSMVLVTQAGSFPARCRPGNGQEAELNLADFDLEVIPVGLVTAKGESGLAQAIVGVPHLVIEVADLEHADLMLRGRTLRSHPALGAAGANVNFVAQGGAGEEWRMRTYERGVEGETLACGTGAVAVAATLAQSGRAKMPVSLLTRSGRCLSITATVSGRRVTNVWLAGEGIRVFRGVI
jgi:diaminopimelate epimerase